MKNDKKSNIGVELVDYSLADVSGGFVTQNADGSWDLWGNRKGEHQGTFYN